MKRFLRPLIIVGIGLILALLSAALTYLTPLTMQTNLTGAAFFLQTTPTPLPKVKDVSEIGSTDGIITMGFIIAFIIIIPILLRRKSWMENH